MPNPTVFDKDFADVKVFRFHKWQKTKVIIFSVGSKLTGRTGFFNDGI